MRWRCRTRPSSWASGPVPKAWFGQSKDLPLADLGEELLPGVQALGKLGGADLAEVALAISL